MDATRRRLLLTVGATTAVAGCLGDNGSPGSGDDDSSGSDRDSGGSNDDSDDTPEEFVWPAVDTGESITMFSEDAPLEPLTGEFSGIPEEARIGEQAMAVEASGEQASMAVFFPDGLDLDGWDLSIAVKAESINRVAIEVHAPEFGDHLTSFRRLPNDHDDWLRVDFGYDEKQGEPDLTNVTELRIFGFSADDGPTRFLVDDLRRTSAISNGKAILACYDGHRSHLDLAVPMLEERGMVGTIAMDPRQIGGSNRMDIHDLRELQDYGWDICISPNSSDGLSGLPEDEQRSIIESAQSGIRDSGFEEGSRHFFAPNWRQYDPTNHAIVRELFDTGFVFGSSTSGIPPTGPHLIPMSWGPALRGGIRRQINIADQYQLLVVLRIPRLVAEEEDVTEGSEMWLGDFEHLLDHLEQRGLDVITPSALVEGSFDDGAKVDTVQDRPQGVILHAGRQHAMSGVDGERTDSFVVEDGILVGSFSLDGGGALSADIIDEGGSASPRVFTRSAGHRTGESIISLDAGEYSLDIEAEGRWELELNQPEVHSDDLMDLPQSGLSGNGPDVIGPFWAPEAGSLSVTHDGHSAFIIDIHAASGDWERIEETTGEFDGNRSYAVTGTVWLNIEADGTWAVDID